MHIHEHIQQTFTRNNEEEMYGLKNEKSIPNREKNADESLNTNYQGHHTPHFDGENEWCL